MSRAPCQAAPRYGLEYRPTFHLRRHSQQKPTWPARALVRVSVSGDVMEDFPSLEALLGAGFEIRLDEPDGAAVAVVGPVGPVGVAFLRTAHSSTELVLVDQFRSDPGSVAACLGAGAAAYLRRPTAVQLAGCVRSLASTRMASVPS